MGLNRGAGAWGVGIVAWGVARCGHDTWTPDARPRARVPATCCMLVLCATSSAAVCRRRTAPWSLLYAVCTAIYWR